MWVKIELFNQCYLLVGTIYGSPSTDPNVSISRLCDVLREVMESNPSYLLIAGDFNLPGIDWGDENFSGNSYEQEFYDTVQECVLFQHVNQSTRFRPGSSPHLLDLVLTNEENIVQSIKYSSGLGLSDHLCLIISFSCSPVTINHSSDEPSYNFKRGDYTKLKSLLNESEWISELKNLSVCESWELFKQHLKSAMDCCIPRYHRNKSKKLPYVNHKVIDLKHKKEVQWKRFRRTGNRLDHLRFTQTRNSLRNLTRTLRSKFEKKIAGEVKNNPKAFWRYVNPKIKVKALIPTLVDEALDGVEAASDDDKAEILSKFFTSTFTRESLDNIPEFQDREFVTSLDDVKIDANIVREKLYNLNPSKATGPDGLPPRVLKEAATEISVPLSIIFKKSLSEGKLPVDWKMATIIPIFKKGNKASPCNYRPVSLTSVVCKVLESIIREGMLEHLFVNNLMSTWIPP